MQAHVLASPRIPLSLLKEVLGYIIFIGGWGILFIYLKILVSTVKCELILILFGFTHFLINVHFEKLTYMCTN